jgi:hypothetical protein
VASKHQVAVSSLGHPSLVDFALDLQRQANDELVVGDFLGLTDTNFVNSWLD